jgi:hypothetical protein
MCRSSRRTEREVVERARNGSRREFDAEKRRISARPLPAPFPSHEYGLMCESIRAEYAAPAIRCQCPDEARRPRCMGRGDSGQYYCDKRGGTSLTTITKRIGAVTDLVHALDDRSPQDPPWSVRRSEGRRWTGLWPRFAVVARNW